MGINELISPQISDMWAIVHYCYASGLARNVNTFQRDIRPPRAISPTIRYSRTPIMIRYFDGGTDERVLRSVNSP